MRPSAESHLASLRHQPRSYLRPIPFPYSTIGKKKAPLEYSPTGRKKELGNDLLSHTLVYSTIGEEGLDFRVRNGIGYFPFSIVTKQNFLSIATVSTIGD
jgi:hypothetical protein